jgi:hypothetical protein
MISSTRAESKYINELRQFQFRPELAKLKHDLLHFFIRYTNGELSIALASKTKPKEINAEVNHQLLDKVLALMLACLNADKENYPEATNTPDLLLRLDQTIQLLIEDINMPLGKGTIRGNGRTQPLITFAKVIELRFHIAKFKKPSTKEEKQSFTNGITIAEVERKISSFYQDTRHIEASILDIVSRQESFDLAKSIFTSTRSFAHLQQLQKAHHENKTTGGHWINTIITPNFLELLSKRVITPISYPKQAEALAAYNSFRNTLEKRLNAIEAEGIATRTHQKEYLSIAKKGRQALKTLDRLSTNLEDDEKTNINHLEEYSRYARLCLYALSAHDEVKVDEHGNIVEEKSFFQNAAAANQQTKKIITPQEACEELQTLTDKINLRLTPKDAEHTSNFTRAIKAFPWRILLVTGLAISLFFISPAYLTYAVAAVTAVTAHTCYKIGSRFRLFRSLPNIPDFSKEIKQQQKALHQSDYHKCRLTWG